MDARERKNARQREYYKKNKATFQENARKYYQENKDLARIRAQQYYIDNREDILEKAKIYYGKKGSKELRDAWYKKNKEKVLEYHRQYRRRKFD